VVDSAAVYKVHQGIGDKGAVDTQILFATEVAGQGLKEWPDGVREAAAILNDRGHLLCHHVKDCVHRPALKGDGGLG